jgi:hypothetical protein
MWNRVLVASLATGVLLLSAIGGASAEGLNTDQWTAFAQQQPLLSRVFVEHEAAAVANLLGISVEQLKSETAEASLVDVAAAHNRSASDVSAVMLYTAYRDLQLAATLGLISQEERADLKAQFEAVLPSLISDPAPTAVFFG